MKKLRLDVEELDVVTFEAEAPSADQGTVAANGMMVTGTTCTTRYPTVYGPCCTP